MAAHFISLEQLLTSKPVSKVLLKILISMDEMAELHFCLSAK